MFKKAKETKTGFTLAELLIVVAIIAVLVAISIPIFTNQLEKSRDAVSVANMRAAYAEAQTLELTATKDGDQSDKATYAKTATGSTVTVNDVVFKGTKTDDNYSGLAAELPFTAPAEPGAVTKNLVFTYNANGELTDVAFGA